MYVIPYSLSVPFLLTNLQKKQLLGLHDWAKQSNVIICPNTAGAGGLPDIGAFYTTEALKEKSDAEIEKMHCFIFGNGGTPSVRDAHFLLESISPSSSLLFPTCILFPIVFLKKICPPH